MKRKYEKSAVKNEEPPKKLIQYSNRGSQKQGDVTRNSRQNTLSAVPVLKRKHEKSAVKNEEPPKKIVKIILEKQDKESLKTTIESHNDRGKKSTIQQHDENQLICQICQKTYRKIAYLEVHMKSHEPVICPKCSEKFQLMNSKEHAKDCNKNKKKKTR